MKHASVKPSKSTVWMPLVGVICGIAVLSWVFWPSRVALTPDTYPIAVALYRVCNQQDGSGLEKIQARLSELDADGVTDASVEHLQGIVDEADSGQWQSAMKRARRAMDDQVSGT